MNKTRSKDTSRNASLINCAATSWSLALSPGIIHLLSQYNQEFVIRKKLSARLDLFYHPNDLNMNALRYWPDPSNTSLLADGQPLGARHQTNRPFGISLSKALDFHMGNYCD